MVLLRLLTPVLLRLLKTDKRDKKAKVTAELAGEDCCACSQRALAPHAGALQRPDPTGRSALRSGSAGLTDCVHQHVRFADND